MTAARENQTRVKTRAAFKSGSIPEIPEAARAAGHFGKVRIVGIIGIDGRFSETTIATSSRSDILDTAALAAAQAAVFEPARDANGEPLAIRVVMPFEFSNAKSAGKGGGALRYKCDQFARDYDWWFKTWPADEKDDFYYLVLGLTTTAQLHAGKLDASNVRATTEGFEARWKKAVKTCQAKPDKLFLDVFKPEGDMLRRLAGG